MRGVRLNGDDTVISMAILRRVDATPAERAAYLKEASRRRAATSGEGEGDDTAAAPEAVEDEGEDASEAVSLSEERFNELAAAEEFILTIADTGFGKRTSSYDYRRTGRGGQGIVAIDLSKRGGKLVASFPIEVGNGLLLVTDTGQLIRTNVSTVRIASRNTQGVTIFRTSGGGKVVSVERIVEAAEDDAETPSLSDQG